MQIVCPHNSIWRSDNPVLEDQCMDCGAYFSNNNDEDLETEHYAREFEMSGDAEYFEELLG